MEFTNLQFQGINMGVCGSFDVQFLKIAAVKWQELEDVIRGHGHRHMRTPEPGTYGNHQRGDYPHSPYTPPDE